MKKSLAMEIPKEYIEPLMRALKCERWDLRYECECALIRVAVEQLRKEGK